MDILGKLFGSAARVKIMRLFLLNADTPFESADVVKKSKVTAQVARKELSMLHKIGFISKKSFFKEVPPRSKNGKPRKKRVSGWQLNRSFALLQPLHNLVVNTEPLGKKEIVDRLKRCGNMKLIIIAGAFIQNPDSRVDMLIVGDRLKKGAIDNVVGIIESEVGKELSYAAIETSEFTYRLGVYDKFVRDILDYPHIVVLDKLGVGK